MRLISKIRIYTKLLTEVMLLIFISLVVVFLSLTFLSLREEAKRIKMYDDYQIEKLKNEFEKTRKR